MRVHKLITKSDVLETALWLTEHRSQGYIKRSYGVFRTGDTVLENEGLENPYIVWYAGYPKLREILQSFLDLHGEKLAIELKRDCFLGKAGEVVGFIVIQDERTSNHFEVPHTKHEPITKTFKADKSIDPSYA
jgi:hypothetical protein